MPRQFCNQVDEIFEEKWSLIQYIRSRGYKPFSMLNSAEHEIYLLINVKVPTVVGILTFISMINKTYNLQTMCPDML